MEIRIFQKGFNFSQDGPGNRLVYHMQGCNMRCQWCSNPEGLDSSGGICVSVDDIVNEAERSRSMFFSGGGVTFTGGEPTIQFDALMECLQKMHQKRINTAIETNASHPRFRELLPFIDNVIMDLKFPFSEEHLQYTGVHYETVKSNIQYTCHHHSNVLIHIPFINGYNSSLEMMKGFGNFLSILSGTEVKVEILPYHEYGKAKWEKLGRSYTVADGYVSNIQLSEFRKILQQRSVKLIST